MKRLVYYTIVPLLTTSLLASSCSIYRQSIPRLGPMDNERDKDEISKLEHISADADALKTIPYSLK